MTNSRDVSAVYDVWYANNEEGEPLCFMHALDMFANHNVIAMRHVNTQGILKQKHTKFTVTIDAEHATNVTEFCSCGQLWGHT